MQVFTEECFAPLVSYYKGVGSIKHLSNLNTKFSKALWNSSEYNGMLNDESNGLSLIYCDNRLKGLNITASITMLYMDMQRYMYYGVEHEIS